MYSFITIILSSYFCFTYVSNTYVFVIVSEIHRITFTAFKGFIKYTYLNVKYYIFIAFII